MKESIRQTKHLVLRPFIESDLKALHEYASDPDVVKYMTWGAHTPQDSRLFLEMAMDNYMRSKGRSLDFAVVLKQSGKVIGGCHIYSEMPKKEAAVGWVLNKNYWNRGYGTEIAGEIIKIGFQELNLRRIWSCCDTLNHGSYMVMEKNRMRREGVFLKSRFCKGEWHNEYLYAILKEEWEAHHAERQNVKDIV